MKKIDSIPAAALLLATSVLLSRLLGYVREMLLAYQHGAGATTDAFYAAFQIPDLLNYFLAGGALSIAFIPMYNRILARDGAEAAEKLTANILGTLGTVAIVATVALWWHAEALLQLQFPAFDAATLAETTRLTRIVLPAQIFFIVGGIIQAVLMAHRHFHAAALAPLIYNTSTIAGGWFGHAALGIDGFAWGTLAGAFLGPFLMPFLFGFRHIRLRVSFDFRDKNFLVYLALAAPLMFGQTLLTLDEWYGKWFGALLATGTVAHLSFARRLMHVPIAVIGQALAAAALPTLSRLWAENKIDELNTTLLRTLQGGLGLAILAMAAIHALAQPLVSLVYQQGAFTADDTTSVAVLTALLALAVPGWIVQQIAVRGFYARCDTWRPMMLGTLLSIAAIPLYLYMSRLHGATGIAMAGAIAMNVNALATLIFARTQHTAPLLMPLLNGSLRMLAVAAAGWIAAAAAMPLRQKHLPFEGMHLKMQALADLAAGGAAFGLVALAGILAIGDASTRALVRRCLP